MILMGLIIASFLLLKYKYNTIINGLNILIYKDLNTMYNWEVIDKIEIL